MDGIMYSVRFYLKTIGVFWLSFTRDSRALVSETSLSVSDLGVAFVCF